jgi:GDP-L-fucose synthase
MDLNAKIFLAGHNGLVGSAIYELLRKSGYVNIITRTKKELDLLEQEKVTEFFKTVRPEYVILAAARVGGILANSTYRADFIYENLQIQNNIIHNAYLHNVKKLLFLGSSCIYPKEANVPIKENELLSSFLEYSNEPYAIAKIAGLKMCESYNIQYGTNFIAVMPTNMYGLNDNFNLETSHVLPALIRKIYLGKCLSSNKMSDIIRDLKQYNPEILGESETLKYLERHGITKNDDKIIITLWGTGAPLREFLFAEDMAEACLFLMQNTEFEDLVKINHIESKEIRNTHINLGSGKDISIKDLASMIAEIIEFDGVIQWDTNKPDGTMRKTLDVSKLKALGWVAKTELKEGIETVYRTYLER